MPIDRYALHPHRRPGRVLASQRRDRWVGARDRNGAREIVAVRVNLRHVPEAERPAEEPPDPALAALSGVILGAFQNVAVSIS